MDRKHLGLITNLIKSHTQRSGGLGPKHQASLRHLLTNGVIAQTRCTRALERCGTKAAAIAGELRNRRGAAHR